MPQNQGMGLALIVETNRMPVGNPKPIRSQHKDAKAGANDKVRSIEAEHDRQRERQRK